MKIWPFLSSVEQQLSAAMTQQNRTELITEAHEGKWDLTVLSGSSQCIWFHTSHAFGKDTGTVPCPEQHQRPPHRLL